MICYLQFINMCYPVKRLLDLQINLAFATNHNIFVNPQISPVAMEFFNGIIFKKYEIIKDYEQ